MHIKTLVIAIATAVSFSVAAEASTVNGGTVISSPATIGGFSFDLTIDQSGLSDNYVSGVTDYDTYIGLNAIHTRSSSPANFAATFSTPPLNVDYDLGSSLNIEGLLFWNYPFATSGPVTAFDMFVSSTIDFSISTLVGAFSPVIDGDGSTNAMQLFDSIDTLGRYVRIAVTDTQNNAGTGWSEIAFRVGDNAPAPVPVPAGLPLLVTALGCFGLVRRKKS